MKNLKPKKSLKRNERRIAILGDEWVCELTTVERVRKLYGGEATAFVDMSNRRIYFSVPHFTLGNVIHEVGHAMYDSLCLESTVSLSLKDLEEIWCSFLARNAVTIVRTANEILRAFK